MAKSERPELEELIERLQDRPAEELEEVCLLNRAVLTRIEQEIAERAGQIDSLRSLATSLLTESAGAYGMLFAATGMRPKKEVGKPSLARATERVVRKEAWDLLETGMEKTWIGALTASYKRAGQRYRRGKCALCKGPALPCAERHFNGRSCG